MSDIISSTYEILGNIGHGGGGNIYLAYHKRLGKKVVLKIDKRKITTSKEILRREVDVLKDLTHSYIPTVYDFVVENDNVYTVIDYVEGESLDKALKRGQVFSQPQVIKWAKQALCALAYLHAPIHGEEKKGYVHSDIKPANIMLKPNGDISLIDFNISLALGESNAVGHSPGYASPEHYGIDYSSENNTFRNTSVVEDADPDGESPTISAADSISSPLQNRTIIPDVRSDIYSLGATLYHLLSGQRPSQDAKDVIPLSSNNFSQQIVDIISKAMNPNPDLRFQSAAEMLSAFNQLRSNDVRTIKLKRTQRIFYYILSVAFVISVFISFMGLNRMRTAEKWLNYTAIARAQEQHGDLDSALRTLLQIFANQRSIFSPFPSTETLRALTNASSVYNLQSGFKSYCIVDIPSEVLNLTLSDDGKTAAVLYLGHIALIDTESATIIQTLDTVDSALCECEFINDTTIVFSGQKGITVYDIEKKQYVWTGELATAIAVSGDRTVVAGVYRDANYSILYNAFSGEVIKKIDFAGKHQSVVENDLFANPNNNIFSLNDDASALSVSFSDGSLVLFGFGQELFEIELVNSTNSFTHFEGGFYDHYFTYSASRTGKSIFEVFDLDTKEKTGGFESDGFFSTKASRNGVFVCTENILVQIDPGTGEQKALVNTDDQIKKYAIADIDMTTSILTSQGFSFFDNNANTINEITVYDEYDFLALAGSYVIAGSRNTNRIRILRYEDNTKSLLYKYSDGFVYDEARITNNENLIMLFSYKHFRIYKCDGTLVCEQDIPNCNDVYDQQFRRNTNGDYLEVIYNNGESFSYSANTGKLIKTQQNIAIDPTLKEIYDIDKYTIESPLHGNPIVYEKRNGHFVKELKTDDYLTYVTQLTTQLIVAQYITADGYYYGQLINENFEIIADLPYLCDINNNCFYFGYPNGEIHKSVILSQREIIDNVTRKLNGGY